jgi:hypothetical protein
MLFSDIKDIKDCPWRWSRKSPSKEEIYHVIQYLEAKEIPRDTFLEFGAGISTWYFSQLGFTQYVCVEDYESALIQVRKHLPNVKIVSKWVDIPVQKYRYVFVDSHVGGDAGKYDRYKTLEYALKNGLIMDDAIVIAHDHAPFPEGDLSYRNVTNGWYGVINKYGWNLVKQIPLRRSFAIYEKNMLITK